MRAKSEKNGLPVVANGSLPVIAGDSFCIMPWVHLHVTQNGNVMPCCMSQDNWDGARSMGNINEHSISEIWNGEAMRAFRLKLLNGEGDERCERCYAAENVGNESLRESINTEYQNRMELVNNTRWDGGHPEAVPVFWDIRFSNLCNLRCRICHPWASSRWHRDAVAIGVVPSTSSSAIIAASDREGFLKDLSNYVADVEEIYFAGGEPLLMEEHYRLLNILIEARRTDVRLRYSSNLAYKRSKAGDILDYWRRFDHVEVLASIDDSRKRAQLQRKDLEWDVVVAFRREMISRCPHVRLKLSPTISIFNVCSVPGLHREWVESGLLTSAVDINLNLLDEPKEYSIRIIPNDSKACVTELYEGHIQWLQSVTDADRLETQRVVRRFHDVIRLLKSGDDAFLIPSFVEKCRVMDALRNEKTFEVLSELNELLGLRGK